jgi:hypothetical protein
VHGGHHAFTSVSNVDGLEARMKKLS